MPIAIHQNLPLAAAQGVTTPVALQPGSVITAKVQQILGNDTVTLVIAGQLIEAQSKVTLQAGQILQLAVSQSADGSIGLAIVGQPSAAAPNQAPAAAAAASLTTDSIQLAPNAAAIIAAQPAPGAVAASSQLTVLEALAVSSAAQSAATQQASLSQLFSNLSVASQIGGLPPQVLQAVAQLLARRTDVASGLTGDDVSQAFQNSGLFLEASLANGSVPATIPDLKAALIVLRQALTLSLDAPAAAPLGSPVSSGASASAESAAAPAAALGAPIVPQRFPAIATSLTPAAFTVISPTPLAPGAPQPGTAVAAQALPEVPASQVALSPPVAITTEATALDVASTVLAPLLASATAMPAALSQATAVPVTPSAGSLVLATAVLSSPVAPAEAAARAAAGLAALNLLQETPPTSPQEIGLASSFMLQRGPLLALLPTLNGPRSAEIDDADFVHTNLPPPPLSGALPAPQPVLPATLSPHSPPQTVMQQLLADTEGALARQTLLQVASLPGQADSGAARPEAAGPRWNFEIPLALPQGTAMAQFEISRDGGGNPTDAAGKRVWRARFSLDVEPAGPIHALVALSGGRTSVRMWAERPATVARLRDGVAQLSQALRRAELRLGDIVVQEGVPLAPAAARAGHFLDRAL